MKGEFRRTFTLFLLICMVCSVTAYGQDAEVPKKPKKRLVQRGVSNGFYMGVNMAFFSVKLDEAAVRADSLQGVRAQPLPGLVVGVTSEFRLSKPLSVRFAPAIHVQATTFQYTYSDRSSPTGTTQLETQYEGSYLVLPLALKYRHERNETLASYVLAGYQFSRNLESSPALAPLSTPTLVLKPQDHQLHAGIGLELETRYLQLGVELQGWYGLNNVLIDSSNIFSTPLNSLRSRGASVTLTIQG